MSQCLICADRHTRGKAVAVALAGAVSLVTLVDLAQRLLTSTATVIVTMIILATAMTVALLLARATNRAGRFHVQRALSIRTSVERIVPLINDLRRLDTRPPMVIDPDRSGRVEIIDADPLSSTLVRFMMAEPLAILSRLALILEPQGDAVHVTWATAGELSLLGKALHLILDVDAMIGRTFEAYLADLKILAE
jgi:hypothetical protein